MRGSFHALFDMYSFDLCWKEESWPTNAEQAIGYLCLICTVSICVEKKNRGPPTRNKQLGTTNVNAATHATKVEAFDIAAEKER